MGRGRWSPGLFRGETITRAAPFDEIRKMRLTLLRISYIIWAVVKGSEA